MGTRIVYLCVSDLQAPFEHQDALAFALHVKKTFVQPGDKLVVVNLGDEVDQHTLGRWASNPNGRSAGDELEEAKHRLRDWYKEFPKTYVCTSNHTWRAYRKAFEAGIPSQFMKNIAEVLEAPMGWKWADRWMLDGMCFEHGENVSGAAAALNAALQNHCNTVIGHQHSHGGVIHLGSITQNIWGMNTGCLIDIDQYAFDYGKKLRRKPTLGMGVVVGGIPYFVPMIFDKKKRWVGRI